MPNVVPLPVSNPRVGQCGLAYIGTRLGMDDSAIPTLVRRVRQLVDDHRFPPPLGMRQWRGQLVGGAAAVCLRSRWLRDAVDLWFDGRADVSGLTPDIADALRDRSLAAHSAALDRAAAALLEPRHAGRHAVSL